VVCATERLRVKLNEVPLVWQPHGRRFSQRRCSQAWALAARRCVRNCAPCSTPVTPTCKPAKGGVPSAMCWRQALRNACMQCGRREYERQARQTRRWLRSMGL
jgi:hypothetical protein